jgi:hypothetical protein
MTDTPYNIALIAETALEFITDPVNVWEAIKELNSEGVWSVTGSSSRLTGIPVKGIILALVWVGEFLTLLYFSVKLPSSEAGKPYSERQDKWMSEKALPVPAAFIENVDEFKRAVAGGDYSALTTPLEITDESTQGADEARHAKVTIYPDQLDPYISVQNVAVKFKKKKKDVKTTDVVKYLKITPAAAASIANALGREVS